HQKTSNTVKQLEVKIEKLKEDKALLLLDMAKPDVAANAEKTKSLHSFLITIDKELEKLNVEFDEAYLQLLELEN
ncbi:MAG TPA: hypothetical protein PLO59_04385, partial [Bacteroidia bacterium]|nr:hypothetical protein [Bacteroidia bacterium]